MGDDHLARLHLRADYESRRQVHLQVLDAFKAFGQGGEPEGGVSCFGGFAALFESLWHVAWPSRFKPDASARFDGSSDPIEFLQCYTIAIRAAGGEGRVMANWFPMATKGEPRRWLWGLPPESIASWRGLCECFIDKFAPLGPEPEDP
jgi:hypothetical protein